MDLRKQLRQETKKDLIEMMRETFGGKHLEQILAAQLGHTLVPGINGADGQCLITGQEFEYKGQYFNNNVNHLFRGKGKYSFASYIRAQSKLDNDEQTIFAGVCKLNLEMYYQLQVPFSTIADEYIRQLDLINGKDYNNVDICFHHYKDSPDLKVLYIAPKKVLEANKHKFAKNFHKKLLEFAEDNS